MEIISKLQFDEERALYNLTDATVKECVFAGPADGESALKESRNVEVEDCKFSLRYPLWHSHKFTLVRSSMDELTRAAIWYAQDGTITDSTLGGIKAVRECQNINISKTDIVSAEFGWKSKGISLSESTIESEYLFLDSQDIKLDKVKMNGKYSFQYVKNLSISDSNLDTKDAFWHAENVYVKDSVVKGEYLGWFSNGLTLENCTIIGTQPLCYCNNLKLINCTMQDTDLSFEYSDVEATVSGHIDSIKNPRSGKIICDSVGDIIRENSVMECTGEVVIR